MSRKRKSYIALMRGVMYVCSGLTAALLLFLLGYVLYKGIPNISWEFLSTKPSHPAGHPQHGVYRSGNIGDRAAAGCGCRHLLDGICPE